MSQLVQIAPGVVFSSDVLGVDWARKYRQDDGDAQSTDRQDLAVNESDQAGRTSMPAQLSLL
ncbi:hypothetical protein [Burkholderia cepacia]|uniref:Uncharacterized protein n=1 Tax=Burkholderia cepacia TaxID=292 RepID=A0ABN5D1B5_BURCE|nr:hypothetical protein [Burkholderia cepacia]AIO26470.1 hypothetical protein DM41_6716 [Burkholderia cepacia ATCC 25416]ALK23194.1 hypothetical protein APZ15_35610 [Burkholderia cepacia ATCC 25416]ASE92744.1 hypothetical protein CEQ23_03830 [Burkholderia cepacia]ATF80232.1 hypothetical protein CO711_22945 [Burkholderia cepacia]MCA8465568.1 hypothetical protein [Burkholderia cepacia]